MGILREAEERLRALIEKGLREQRYDEIAELARLTDGVARLHGTSRSLHATADATSPATAPPAHVGRRGSTASKRVAAAHPKKAGNYPRFERDGDRLVKIGWSKKNREVYEHRAPRTAVIAFVRHLTSRVKPGRVFALDSLLPIPDIVSGDEVPAYQVYLTLAWLREAKAVVKKGRDGYALRMESLANDGLDQLWDALPVRSA